MLRIVQRFVRLCGYNDVTTPLAIYRDATEGTVSYITSTEIETTLHAAAAAVYNLDPIKDAKILQMFSAHSYRVGACVILHAMDVSSSSIPRSHSMPGRELKVRDH